MFGKKKKADNPQKAATGFFSWQKNKEAQKRQNIASFIEEVVKHLPAIKEILKTGKSEQPSRYAVIEGAIMPADDSVGTPDSVSPAASRTAKMYDFYLDYTGAIQRSENYITVPNVVMSAPFGVVTGGAISNDNPEADTPAEIQIKKTDQRQSANPKSVLKELEEYPAPDMVDGLDEKIATLKDKSLMTNQRYASEQIQALIKRLENRKRYHEEEAFYKLFLNTNDEKIDHLLSKYKLVVKPIDIFVPTFPKEAIDVMKEYTRITKKICGEEPVYYVIAEEGDFKKKFEKLDPILLVQSPFGFWWQVLGAWDKEMLLLCEL